jgi:hypothetical protein
MISIIRHLSNITDNVEALLDQAAEELWAELNPKKLDGSYKKTALISKVELLCMDIKKEDYIASTGKVAARRHLAFAEYIAEQDTLKKIITALPTEFDSIISTIGQHIEPSDLHEKIKGEDKPRGLGEMLLTKVFNYGNYRGSIQCHNRYKKLKFDGATCPYCNENTMKIVSIEKEKTTDVKMLFDIDHFYPKHLHPYLALSFYNHIPSCKICNQTFKGSKSFTLKTHIHPFHRCFDSLYRFELNHGALINQPIEAVKLKKESLFEDNISSDLQIESRYQGNVVPARMPQLIGILSKYAHLLRGDLVNPEERERLAERLQDFGIVFKKEKILEQCYSKLQRDTIKMFDPDDTLGIFNLN